MKYYIIAGEPSGDLHGSKLIKEIFKLDKNAKIRFWGGDLMKKEGGKIVMHYKNLAFMGFSEVFANIFKILKNFKLCKKDILNYNNMWPRFLGIMEIVRRNLGGSRCASG